jgi:predicted ATPase
MSLDNLLAALVREGFELPHAARAGAHANVEQLRIADEEARRDNLVALGRALAEWQEVEQLRSAVSLVRYADRHMVDGLREAVARGEGYTVSLCAPGARDLAALLDALLALTPAHCCLAVREWQPPATD